LFDSRRIIISTCSVSEGGGGGGGRAELAGSLLMISATSLDTTLQSAGGRSLLRQTKALDPPGPEGRKEGDGR